MNVDILFLYKYLHMAFILGSKQYEVTGKPIPSMRYQSRYAFLSPVELWENKIKRKKISFSIM